MNKDLHPSNPRLHEDAVLAAAVAYREVALRADSTATLQQHLLVENLLLAAVDGYTRHRSTPSVAAAIREQWRGPGFYRVSVSDEHGATSGTAAAHTVEQLIATAHSLCPIGEQAQLVDATWDSPALGDPR